MINKRNLITLTLITALCSGSTIAHACQPEFNSFGYLRDLAQNAVKRFNATSANHLLHQYLDEQYGKDAWQYDDDNDIRIGHNFSGKRQDEAPAVFDPMNIIVLWRKRLTHQQYPVTLKLVRQVNSDNIGRVFSPPRLMASLTIERDPLQKEITYPVTIERSSFTVITPRKRHVRYWAIIEPASRQGKIHVTQPLEVFSHCGQWASFGSWDRKKTRHKEKIKKEKSN